MRTASVWAVAVCFTALCGWGCGRRGDPVAPELRRPGRPTEVRISGQAGELVLSWAPPREDLGGRRIGTALGYLILRAVWPPGEEPCETCPEDLQPVATLDPQERRARGLPQTSWVDPEVRAGWLYRYRIAALGRDGHPGPLSAPAEVRWVAIEPPSAVAEPEDGRARVTVPSPDWPPGLSPVGVRVYDSGGNLLVEGAPSARSVTVTGLTNGVEHQLEVRLAARTSRGWVLESPGAVVTVTPRDTTPPLPPEDLAVSWTAKGIRIRWLRSGREPYAAVLVLRAEVGRTPAEIARVPGGETTYLDRTASPDVEYSYVLVAVDEAGNRSLPTREVRVRPR